MGKLKREFKKRHREAVKRMMVAVAGVGTTSHSGPVSHVQRLMNQPIVASTPILYSDLTGRIPSRTELSTLIKPFRKRPTFQMLCMLNTLLSFYDHDIPKSTYVQGFLFANFIGDPMFDETKRKFARDLLVEHPVFHRFQLLNMLKAVLLEAAEDGAKDPNPKENTQIRYELGEASLMMNNLLFPEEQEEALKKRPNEADEDERIHGELFAQWLPTSELLNVPELTNAIVRNLEYANIFDERFSEFAFGEGRTLSQRFEELTGLELRRYLVMLFNFYLYYHSQSDSLEGLIENSALFNVDTRTVFSKMKYTERELEGFFSLVATDIEELIHEFEHPMPTKYAILPQYNFTPFRRHPFVYINAERTVVTCIDSAFLAEKISTGTYHTILKSLEVEDVNRTKRDESDRKRFLKRYWGEVFQVYVNRRLRDVFHPETNRFFDSPKWDSPKAKANNEAFDGVIDYGDSLIVMEEKGKYLESSAKYSGCREALLEDLHERFGKGVCQLAANLEILLNNDCNQPRHPFSERSEDNQPILQYGLESASSVRKVYPVLVVQDFSLQIGFANRELRNLFAKEIAARKIDSGLVKPLSLITIEDLENLLPYLDEVSFPEILDEYVKPHEPLFGFEHILRQFRKQRKIKRKSNPWIDQRIEELRLSTRELFSVLD